MGKRDGKKNVLSDYEISVHNSWAYKFAFVHSLWPILGHPLGYVDPRGSRWIPMGPWRLVHENILTVFCCSKRVSNINCSIICPIAQLVVM